jgi:carbon monoxide dehydrogenase subunit G
MDTVLSAQPEAIWPIFFDVGRIAGLIPGCEQVEEKELLALYAAVMRQKIGPFKLEVPAEIRVEELLAPLRVRARAKGRDKFTGTTLDVLLEVGLERLDVSIAPVDAGAGGGGTRLTVASTMLVAGRLASLGYPVVKRKAEEIFVEFERRLRAELGIV